ncbi:glycosyltransferase [Sandaracinus amylolyticus]|uniref:glycosyltransferase n=1 Tax=Sandaracinus amylolyticus TaxID=927083 RepID=UPI001F1A703C|nr:glycosyltransferase [Sandaracinus amylolyticus]UJR82164.1 UDP-glucose sterol glucosyltransferase [Sandaracinus amylolyticus]
MRIALVAQGSRGDVQPFVALARALAMRGADVELAAPENFAPFVMSAGVRFVALPGDVQALMQSERGQRVLARGDRITWAREMWAFLEPRWEGIADRVADVAERADAMVVHALSVPFALASIDVARMPLAIGLMIPAGAPTRAYPSPMIASRSLGPLNAATHLAAERAMWALHADRVDARRRRVGLSALRRDGYAEARRARVPVLHAWDDALLPHPSDVPPNVMSTGEWALDVSLDPPIDPELDAWIDEGDAPVYVGFGSLPMVDPRATLAMIERVTARLGVRALIAAGWTASSLETDAPHVRIAGELDHAYVLPRCRAAVHHGGAGTVHATLRAGLPSVIASVYADQPFWGRRIEAMELGATFPLQRLDARRLQRALAIALRPDVRARALAVATRMRDDGADVAARFVIEKLARLTH